MIEEEVFPDQLKIARVAPIYKKKDPLDKENHRPVSILVAVSKIFERTLAEQLTTFFHDIFDPMLSAFRGGYSCQSTLMALTEEWRAALDKNEHVAAVLMDLSKAFDCLPHKLILEKLRAYGVTNSAVNLLSSYMLDRKQYVQLGGFTSTLLNISKGVPQGSILGPIIFNIFINDIFYFLNKTKLYNYADDNTLSYSHPDFNILMETLGKESMDLVEWFSINRMKANPDKFQALAVGKKTFEKRPTFNIGNDTITCDESVKLLGVDLDYKLNFDMHTANICKKASNQINALKRIGKFLDFKSRKTIYHAFILSNFNFCPLIWHFCSQTNNDKLEKLNYRALRFIFQDYESSYEMLLQKMGSTSLHLGRLKQIAKETFKIIHGQSPTYLKDFINIKKCSYSFRYSNLLELPRTNTAKYGTSSFRFLAAKVWNDLPENARKATSFDEFKSLVHAWNGFRCKCAMCR